MPRSARVGAEHGTPPSSGHACGPEEPRGNFRDAHPQLCEPARAPRQRRDRQPQQNSVRSGAAQVALAQQAGSTPLRDQPRQWAQGPQDVQRRMTQKQPVLYPVHSSTHAPARESMQEALQQRPQPCSREAQEQAAQVKEQHAKPERPHASPRRAPVAHWSCWSARPSHRANASAGVPQRARESILWGAGESPATTADKWRELPQHRQHKKRQQGRGFEPCQLQMISNSLAGLSQSQRRAEEHIDIEEATAWQRGESGGRPWRSERYGSIVGVCDSSSFSVIVEHEEGEQEQAMFFAFEVRNTFLALVPCPSGVASRRSRSA